jgi:nucleoside-diphosphate-sugar epimerase
MRILLVGGTGFIGRYLAVALDQAGHEVTVFHRGVHGGDLPSRVRRITASEAAIPILQFPPAVLALAPEVVVHMVPIGQRDTQAAVEAFRSLARRLVVLSSGDVYLAYDQLTGRAPLPAEPPGLLGEDAPLRQQLYPYGLETSSPWGTIEGYEKILAERAVLDDPVLEAVVLRLPRVYGPGDPQHTIGALLDRLRGPSVQLGESEARWRWTHGYVEDMAAAIALVATAAPARGIYNVGESPTLTVEERLTRVAQAIGWQGEVVFGPKQGGDRRLLPDIAYDTSRIRRELGYAEVTTPEEALRRTIDWERQAER